MEDRRSSESEDVLATDPKFQRFASSIDRALKGFEITKEWHDLISCLARLHKVKRQQVGEVKNSVKLWCVRIVSLSIGPAGLLSFHGRPL